ncbi:carbamoyltransferase HypF [Nannocystaceae bacterium ST9]
MHELCVKEIRITGTVQGVGFRPTVWRLANEEGLVGEVLNDGAGLLIRAGGSRAAIERLLARLSAEAPVLARIEAIRVCDSSASIASREFRIAASESGEPRTRVASDAAICAECLAEMLDPHDRRFGHPFVTCTNCGPRFSILERLPYDRANTTMANFSMCARCRAEYEQPDDRRFHAQPIACAECGPMVWLESLASGSWEPRSEVVATRAAAIEAAGQALLDGKIVAIRGLGGYHLACDASESAAVDRLRVRKHRGGKPLAIMVRDAAMARRWVRLDPIEQAVFESPAAPIVVARVAGSESPPAGLAPGLTTLGLMRAYTPLHRLLIDRVDRPLVMTSGNPSEAPQILANPQARVDLAGIADLALMHDREIAHRVDDSLVCVMAGAPRLLRRARGYAPEPIALPPGFEAVPPLLAFGGSQSSTFCLLGAGVASLSPHQGDLDHPDAFDDYRRNLALYQTMLEHRPRRLAADLHPEYRSTALARELASTQALPLSLVQHHHAHVASCMAEHGLARDTPAVLGVALDGLGLGLGFESELELWGGEFLLADYSEARRLASLAPVALPGGDRAAREPWRSFYAHVARAIGWARVGERWPGLALHRDLADKPLAAIQRMLDRGLAVPRASSCGRLFDAVAFALACCPDVVEYAAQPAMQLEALADRSAPVHEGYPFALVDDPSAAIRRLDFAPIWPALFDELAAGVERSTIAMRFHQTLARAVVATIVDLADRGARFDTVVLSGGCMQNRILLEALHESIAGLGFACLSHRRVPANDGGLALGQALVAAARHAEGD